jgi:predicted dehydrogenase
MSKIKFGIVGCGANARRAHIPALISNADVNLVALCDPSPEATAKMLNRTNLQCNVYRNLADLLANEEVDVVDICTPGPTHYVLTKQALYEGVNVLLEKPPTLNLTQAEELASLAAQRNLKLGVVLNTRYKDLILKLKKGIDDGLLGSIVKIHSVHHGPIVYSESPWLWNEKESKYLLYEFAIHQLDLMVYLCGPHVSVIHVLPTFQETIKNTTDLHVIIEFANGVTGILETTADSTRHSSYFTQINVYGTAMDAFIRYFPPSIRFVAGLQNPMAIVFDDIKALLQIGSLIIKGKYLAYRNVSHKKVINSYVDWIKENSSFPLTLEQVLPTMRLLDAIEKQIPSYATREYSGDERS